LKEEVVVKGRLGVGVQKEKEALGRDGYISEGLV
jgi:hypothetical protein